jgi:hypothetical protein
VKNPRFFINSNTPDVNSKELSDFVEASKISHNQESRCVDGRYEGLDPFPAIAKPGADAGDVMVALGAINLLNIQLPHDAVLSVAVENAGGPEKFRFHTDSHADEEQLPAGMGCGHLKQAKLDPSAYGLTQEQIDFIFAQLPELLARGAKQEVLPGQHAEQAVVVVKSEQYSLKPLVRDTDGVREVFVYHQTFHNEQLRQLAVKIHNLATEHNHSVDLAAVEGAMSKVFNMQLTQTLQRLAPDLPTHEVVI